MDKYRISLTAIFARMCRLSSLTLACFLMSFTAQAADSWPDRTVNIIVPFPPGGATDQLGRIVAQHLGESLNEVVIVQNRAGAGGMIGSQTAARSDPDGYTLLLGSIANVLNEFLYKEPAVEVSRDLETVSQLIQLPNYVATSPESGINNLDDLMERLKTDPQSVSCGTSGVGTSPFLSCELMKSMAKADALTVPYSGGIPAIQSTLAGDTTIVFSNEVLPFITNDRLIGLAVTTPERSTLTPDIPALSEKLPGYDVTSWYGLFAPKGTPEPILKKLSDEIEKILKDPAVAKKFEVLGGTPKYRDYQEFEEYVNDELVRWGDITRPMNIRLD